VRRAPLEALILSGLRQRLMAPEMMEEFVAAFHAEVNRHRRDGTAARAGKERELAEVTHKLDKLIEALIEGYRTARLQQRLEELEARKAALEQELAADPPPLCACTRTSPRSTGPRSSGCMRHWPIARYGTRRSASCAGLIERVVIHPAEDGPQIELMGRILTMVALGLNAQQAALPQ
jgi:site-specific DNA recombinase